MARPIKDGVDYFPLDVHMDTKVELIEAEFGLIGFAVVVKLYQLIYGQCGYYCEWNDEVALLFGRRIGLGGSAVSEIVSAAIRRGLFDKKLYDSYGILTSRGIQKRYLVAVSRRKQVQVKQAYLLVECVQIADNVCINPVNVNNNSKNVYNNTQSKVKESKVDKSKVSKRDNAPNTSTLIEQLSVSEDTKSKIGEWLIYKKERRETYQPMGIKSLLTTIEHKCKEYSDEKVISLIDECMANGWKGIIWDRLDRPNRRNDKPRVDPSYDLDAMDKLALMYTPPPPKEGQHD